MSKPKYKYKSYNYPKLKHYNILESILSASKVIDSRSSKGRSNYMVVSSTISNFLNI